MPSERKGGDLFIVDNSISGWTALRYLQEWTSIAESFDIATGFFEIGALLALDGQWQKLERIRILMGSEVTERTKAAILAAVKSRAEQHLDESIEECKEKNPFLTGVPAIVDALSSGKIHCRIYDRKKFHAKTYITHAKMAVVGAQALVGSSNFTEPGLTENVELNIQVQSGREVAQLQQWFDEHWDQAEDVTQDILKVIVRHTLEYTPFDVYAKALSEFFKGHEMTAGEWEESRSRVFHRLDRYQKEAYWALMKIARQHGGAFLCDGVGLGKTFVGLMLIERLVLHEGKRVVLFAPKGTKEAVWEPHLREILPHIGGFGGGADFSNLAVFSHTDLGRKGDFPDRFSRIAELADAVVIDEAHHFRNPGAKGDSATGEGQSRYYELFQLLDPAARNKTVFLLTATPINNRLADFRHMAELFTRRDEAYFARTLGIQNFTAHFNNLEKVLQRQVGDDKADATEHLTEARDILATDQTFRELVIQRSRAYARESQLRETGNAAMFPTRMPPQVADYSIRKTYGRLLDMFEQAFQKANPLFTLPIYYPLAWYRGEDKSIDPFEENRQRQVVGLIRTQFLKRFESSVCAFELSCDRLMKKLVAFLEVHSETDAEKKRLQRWRSQNAAVLGYAAERQLEFWGDDEEDVDEDVVPEELLDAVERLDRREYDVVEMMQETFLDLDQIVHFLEETRKFKPMNDDKLQKLIRLLKSKSLAGDKVLIFTEFADTARYLYRQLKDAGISSIAQVDSGTKGSRLNVIKRFSPYYNGTSSGELADDGQEEIRVLISTDVLSEGLNLQDASKMVNYDIHWNPVRLMQRIGRVDRRMNPEVERRLVADHPEAEKSRGSVAFWNFLPPDELNAILTLYTRVTQKVLLISKTLGIEGRKLLRPEDLFDDLKVYNGFSEEYEGMASVMEAMHLEYQDLLMSDPSLPDRLQGLPCATFSGRERPPKGIRGVFFCYSLPALDKETGVFSEQAGTTRWYLYDMERDAVLEEPGEIIESIRCKRDTARVCVAEEKTLKEIRGKVLKHIKGTYFKQVQAPAGVKPSLKAWMEIG